jgi:lysozyme
MELSAAGLDLVKRSEGFREHIYEDVAGLPTIGYGHRVLPHESYPAGIAEPQAAELLSRDLAGSEQMVRHLVRVPLTQGQFDALVDFCFNMGAGRLAASTLLKALNRGRYDDAAEQLLRWDLVDGEVSPGLRTRRQAELHLWQAKPEQHQSAA